jgi:hypothetical protein
MSRDDASIARGPRRSTLEVRLTRREVLVAGAAALGTLGLGARSFAEDEPYRTPDETRAALGDSPLVYISPLDADGGESSCHGEVWYFVDGESVVIVTAADRWKVAAIRSGRDRARVWVGDHGPAWRAGKRYRKSPTFLAKAQIDTDRAVFDRLMSSFATRYAEEWDKWKPRFDTGYTDGSRLVVRYTPIGK